MFLPYFSLESIVNFFSLFLGGGRWGVFKWGLELSKLSERAIYLAVYTQHCSQMFISDFALF